MHASRVLARAGGTVWRIVLFTGLYLGFTVLGGLLLTAAGAPPGPLSGGGVLLSLLAALLAGWIMMVGVERRPAAVLGFPFGRAALREGTLGTGVGAALIGGVVLLLVATGSARWIPDAGTPESYLRAVAGGLLFFAVAAAAEEALFRGYPFQLLVGVAGAVPATLLASALFAAAHLTNPNVGAMGITNIFLAGVLLSVAYLRTRSLWFATAVHLGWNWTMSALLDLPVSGLVFDTPLYDGVLGGAEWWTGGVFGPEAGAAATLVLGLGTVWLLRTTLIGVSPDLRGVRTLPDQPFWTAEG